MKLIPRRNYYCLVAGLPDILLDEGKMKTGIAELREEIEANIHPDDLPFFNLLFLNADNKNLLNLLSRSNAFFDEQGIYPREFFDAEIKEPDRILPYMRKLILNYKSDNHEFEGKSWENELEEYFYAYLLRTKNEFLREWFTLQLNIANCITAFNCREHGISVENELIGNNFVVNAILRSNARDFGLIQDFPEIEALLHLWESSNLLQREKELDLLRWEWIDENLFFHYFDIERVLGFMIQLKMVDRWMQLDKKEGERLFRSLVDNLVKSYRMPDEFNFQTITRK